MVSSRLADQVGRVLGGRYRLVAPLGAGASARVYLADDVTLARRVAVKMLHPALADDDAFLRRFEAEARAAAALSHPHVLAVYDWGRDDETAWLVLEHLGGGSLRALLERGHRLTPSQALVVGLQAARALDLAHRRGIVHRDVKPANLLFDDEGRVRVADFGLARALAEAGWTEPAGSVVGTARYASPEQARGERVDGRADVYALGLSLIEAVTGQVPFAADTTIATLMARVDTDLVVPPELGPLAPVLEAVGRNRPGDRPDAGEVAERLLEVARSLPAPGPLPLAGPDVAADLASDDLTAAPGAAGPAAPDVAAGEVAEGAGEESGDGATGGAGARPGRRRRRWPRLVLAAVVLAALAVGGAVAWTTLAAPAAAVPELIGLLEPEARARLDGFDEYGWSVEVDRRRVDGTDKGRVLDQEPEAGDELREGGTLRLVVSMGPTLVEVPEVGGQPEADARAALTATELAVGEVTHQHHEEVPEGTVLDWTPQAAQLPKGERVDLVVSAGPAPRTVPELAGAGFADAEAELAARGLAVARRDVFHSGVDEGLVVRTEPPAGATVDRGSTVTVVVSQGPDLVTVPELEGESLDDAEEALEEAGLRLGEVAGRGNEVCGSNPEAGEQVERGSEVEIFLCDRRGRGRDDD